MNTDISAMMILAYLLLTLGLPTLRHRISQGEWPVTFLRDGDPFQRLIGALTGLLLAGGIAWALVLLLHGAPPAGWHAPPWLAWIGVALLATGATLELTSQLTMGASFRVGIDDRPTALVQRGPFRIVRNPVFTGLLIAVVGVVLMTPSAWTIMGALWIASLIAIQVRLEERHLRALHGEEYLRYARLTGRFIPGLGTLEGMSAKAVDPCN